MMVWVRRGSALIVSGLLLLIVAAPLLAQPPHADIPLPERIFTIDASSPTSIEIPMLTPSTILAKPGPSVLFGGLGLTATSELDGFSTNRIDEVQSLSSVIVLFGVDRNSIGSVASDAGLVIQNRPFNVMDQADRNQAAADIFMSTSAFDQFGQPTSRGSRTMNNTLARNQGDTGGVDQDLSPNRSATLRIATTQPVDNKNGMTKGGSTGSSAKPKRGANDPVIFFTIARLSEAPPSTGGGIGRGADIFIDPQPNEADTEERFLAAPQIGLVTGTLGDDIDALFVIDEYDDGLFTTAADIVLFSLAPGSPTLINNGYSPADIFAVFGNNPSNLVLWTAAANVGLDDSDNIDALDLMMPDDVSGSVLDHAIQLVVPGDYDPVDGILGDYDCEAFGFCYSGPGVPFDPFVDTYLVDVGPGSFFTPLPPGTDPLFIETGDTVEWIWQDGPHSVVSGLGSPDGAFSTPGAFNAGDVWSHTFGPAFVDLFPVPIGEYHYFSDVPLDVAANMRGSVVVYQHACATFDLDFDGDVDCDDWQEFKAVYAYPDSWANGGVCIPLTIPEFVAVLLGTSTTDVHYCMGDVNDDWKCDGRDVQAYVNAKL